MNRIATIRQPAVAGRFYPADAGLLARMIQQDIRNVARQEISLHPKAIIVPHAGYQYSGPVAASGYAQLSHVRETTRRVLLLGPSHHVAFAGMALPAVDAFATPLGQVALDQEAIESVRHLPQVIVKDAAHRSEHSLEVQLPFLQCVLDNFMIVPFCVGASTAAAVAEVLLEVWGGDETLIVASSDLSHYHTYQTAQALDRQTSVMIENCRWQDLRSDRACGCVGISGLLMAAKTQGLSVRNIDLRSSGDTAGSRDQVVGYGAYVID